MGEVLIGHHRSLERTVAVKCLPRPVVRDAEMRRRFGIEARVLSSLDHPHVVPVFDYVEGEEACLLVMQALTGGTVWDRFCATGISRASSCAIALATCAGLGHAHSRGVLHLDVKPDNLMFDEHHVLKITDFGLAAILDDGRPDCAGSGSITGTPAYMAPEQVDGSRLGPTTDVYAVGAVLYELLSGRLPFDDAGDAVATARRRCRDDPAPLAAIAPDVPEPLCEVVMGALARRPGDRPGSAHDLGAEVARAAASAWGPGWLDRTDVQVLAGRRLTAAATGTAIGRWSTPTSATHVRGGPGAASGPGGPGAGAGTQADPRTPWRRLSLRRVPTRTIASPSRPVRPRRGWIARRPPATAVPSERQTTRWPPRRSGRDRRGDRAPLPATAPR